MKNTTFSYSTTSAGAGGPNDTTNVINTVLGQEVTITAVSSSNISGMYHAGGGGIPAYGLNFSENSPQETSFFNSFDNNFKETLKSNMNVKYYIILKNQTSAQYNGIYGISFNKYFDEYYQIYHTGSYDMSRGISTFGQSYTEMPTSLYIDSNDNNNFVKYNSDYYKITASSSTNISFTLYQNPTIIINSTFTNGNWSIDGQVDINNTIDSLSTTSGALIIDGGVGIQKKLNVGGAVDLNSTLNVDGAFTLSNSIQSTNTSSGSLIVSGGVAVQKNLNIGGAVDLNSTLNVDGITTLTSTTESVNVSTGALIVSGSIGLAKNMYVGGAIRFGGNASEIQEPPAMTNNTFVGPNGTYIASASSYFVGYNLAPYLVFDGNIATYWQTGTQVYNSSGIYTGSNGQNGYSGEWIQIQLPNAIRLDKFSMLPLSNIEGSIAYARYRSPRDFRVFGSNNGSSWTQLFDTNNLEWTIDTKVFTVTGNQNSYTYYKFVVNKTGNASLAPNNDMIWLNLNQIYLYEVTSEYNVEIDKTLSTLNNVDIEGITTITNSTNASNLTSGALVVSGGVSIAQSLLVGGSFILNNSIQSTNTSSGALVISGGLGIQQNTNIGGITQIWNTTNASNTSTGALVVSGGTSISKDLYVAGNTYKTSGSSQLWSISSDKRIKENITDVQLDQCINSIMAIRLRNFNYTSHYLNTYKLDNKTELGVIADELFESHPDSVTLKDIENIGELQLNNFKTINMSKQIFELIGSVQFFASKIQSLTSQIQNMQNVIDDLTQQLNNK